MNIRSFQPVDKAAVIELWKRCGLVVPWNDPAKDIERKMSVGAELFLVGELDASVVATAMGGYDGHRGWVNYLAVQTDIQGRGYARQLMGELEDRLTALGCPKLNIQVRETNVDVLRFYEALGYRQDACVSLGKRLIPDEPL